MHEQTTEVMDSCKAQLGVGDAAEATVGSTDHLPAEVGPLQRYSEEEMKETEEIHVKEELTYAEASLWVPARRCVVWTGRRKWKQQTWLWQGRVSCTVNRISEQSWV
eukprot:TRINITY_DN55234_c0_g1_i1.p2 TRINITY_DN55234_c0_g1~~TRINITY_DN55234_c0_g1_i1.p2  ORF type:complete len:107 (+),score=21.91 TRINITY_DN55234_c0_g1_i1:597-917(+)